MAPTRGIAITPILVNALTGTSLTPAQPRTDSCNNAAILNHMRRSVHHVYAGGHLLVRHQRTNIAFMVRPAVPSEIVTTLVQNHRRFLQFLERRVGNREDAEEILQAAFTKSVQKEGDIRDGEKAIPWFYRLLRNAIVDHFRHRAVEQRALEALSGDPLSLSQEGFDPAAEAVLCECLHELIDTPKPEYRGLLRRVDLEGSSIADAARNAGISTNNARVRLHRARKALRKQLELACGTCTEHACLDCSCQRGALARQRSRV